MKRKSFIIILSLCTAASVFSSCSQIAQAFDSYECDSTGPVVTRTMAISDINAISSDSGLGVIYTQSDSMKVTVSAPDDVMPLIETVVEDGRLKCTSSKRLRGCANLVRIYVQAPAVSEFDASSGSAINIDAPYRLPNRDVSVSTLSGAAFNAAGMTAANIDVTSSSGSAVSISGINVKGVSGKASSGSAMSIAGKCDDVTLKTSSGAAMSAGSLSAQTGSARASSGGSITCSIKNPDEIKSSSGGSISNLN